MPNFEVGGIDVRAEPSFTGFARETKARLDEIEGGIPPFAVSAEPKLVRDFKGRLRELVARGQSGIRSEIEFTPVLAKGFKERLRALLDKGQAGVRAEIEFTPKLSTGFKTDLRALVDKAQTGIRSEIEFSPKLASAFRTKLRDEAKAAAEFSKPEINFSPSLASGFKTGLRDLAKEAAVFARTAVEFEPRLVSGFKSQLRERIQQEGAVAVNARLQFANKEQLRRQLKDAIDAAAAGLRVRVSIDLVPDTARFRERMAAVERFNKPMTVPLRINQSALGNDLKRGFSSALGGIKTLTSIPVKIATVGAAALSPVVSSLKAIGGLALTAVKGFGLLAAGIATTGALGIKQAGDLEFQQRSLNILLNSNVQGTKVFNQVLDLAARTPFQVPDLSPAVKQLHLAGIATKDLVPSLTSLADLTAALGRQGPNIQGVAVALSKIQGKGVVDMRQLNAITQQLPGFSAVKAIADSLGKTVPETFQLIKDKAIPANVAIAAIVNGFRTQLPQAVGFAGKAATETFKGALSNFPDLLRITFYRSFKNSLPAITQFLGPQGDLVNALKKVLPAISDAFVPVVHAILSALSALAPALSQLVQSSLPLIQALGTAVGNLGPGLTVIARTLGIVFGPIAKILPGVATSLSRVFAVALTAGAPAFHELGTGLGAFVVGLGKALELLAPALPLFAQLGGTIARSLGALLPVLASALLPALQSLAPVANDVVRAIANLLIALTPLIPVLATVVAQVIKGLLPAFVRLSQPDVVNALISIVQSFGDILIAITPIVPLLVDMVAPLVQIVAFKPVLYGLVAAFVAYKAAVAGAAITNALFGTAAEQAAVSAARVSQSIVDSLTAEGAAMIGAQQGLEVASAGSLAGGFGLSAAAIIPAAVIAGVVALSAAVFELYKHWKPFHDIVDSTWQFIKRNFIPVLIATMGPFQFLIGLVTFAATHLGSLTGVLGAVGRQFENVGGTLARFGRTVLRDVTGPFESVAGTVARFGATVGRDVGGIVETIVRFFQLLPGRIVHIFSQLPGQVGRAIARFGPDLLHAAGFVIGAFIASFIVVPFRLTRLIIGWGPTIIHAVVRAFAAVVNYISSIPGRITHVFHGAEPGVRRAATGLIVNVGLAIAGGLRAALIAIIRFPGQAVSAIARWGPALGRQGARAFRALTEAAARNLSGVIGALGRFPANADRAIRSWQHGIAVGAHNAFFSIYSTAVGVVQSTVRAFIRFGPDLINGFFRGLKNAVVGIGRALRDIWQGIVDGFKSVLGISSPSTVFFNLGVEVIQGLINGVASSAGALLNFLGGLASRIAGAFVNGLGSLYNAGVNIVQGLINGISSGAGSLWDTATSLASGAWNAVSSFFHFGSPSKLMFQAGVNVALGLTNGIKSKLDQARVTGKSLATALTEGVLDGRPKNSLFSQMFPNGLLGDFNQSGTVTAAERVSLQRLLRSRVTAKNPFPNNILGDFNQSGQVTSAESRRLSQFFLRISAATTGSKPGDSALFPNKIIGDFNQNGRLTLAELRKYLLQHSLLGKLTLLQLEKMTTHARLSASTLVKLSKQAPPPTARQLANAFEAFHPGTFISVPRAPRGTTGTGGTTGTSASGRPLSPSALLREAAHQRELARIAAGPTPNQLLREAAHQRNLARIAARASGTTVPGAIPDPGSVKLPAAATAALTDPTAGLATVKIPNLDALTGTATKAVKKVNVEAALLSYQAGQDVIAKFYDGARSKSPAIQKAFNLLSSGFQSNNWSVLLSTTQSVIGNGVAKIAQQFGGSNARLTRSDAERRDKMILSWVLTHKGTVEQANRMIATLNGNLGQYEVERTAKAKTMSDKIILAYVLMHGGTVAEAKQMIADHNKIAKGGTNTLLDNLTHLRVSWVKSWVDIHKGTIHEATQLYDATVGHSLTFHKNLDRENATFKEKWIAHWIAINGGTQKQANDLFNKTQAAALFWRSVHKTNVENMRSDYITNWQRLHLGSVAEAIASYNDLARHAQKGGTDIGLALLFGLEAQRAKIRQSTNDYSRDIRDPLNNVLRGIGVGEIPAVSQQSGGRVVVTRNTGGVIPMVKGAVPHRDSVIAALTPNEYVVTERRTAEQGVHKLRALNEGRADIVYRNLPRYAAGGLIAADRIAAAEAFGNAQVGKPYIWGAVGPNGFDCSGLASALLDAIFNLPTNRRLFTSASLVGGAGAGIGLLPGLGQVSIGAENVGGKGHVAVTIAGRNYEATPPVVRAGPGARGADNPMFTTRLHLGSSTFIGGGGTSLPVGVQLKRPPTLKGAPWLDALANGEMLHTYLVAQNWANQHTQNTVGDPAGGAVGISGGPPTGAVPGNVEQWLAAGMALAGVSGNRVIHDDMIRLMRRESNFQPHAINLWDSNARAGHPSKGIAQMIDASFRTYMVPGHTDIWNPVDEIASAIRYIQGRLHGNFEQAASHAYEYGGIVRHEDVVRVAEGNKAEAIIPLTKPVQARQVADQSGLTKMLSNEKSIHIDKVTVEVTPPNVDSPEAYGASLANRLAPALAAAVERALH